VPTPDDRPAITAYVSYMSNLPEGNDFEKLGTDCGNMDLVACQADAVQTRDDAQQTLAHIRQMQIPPPFLHVNGLIYQAMQDYVTGCNQLIDGVDTVNSDEVMTASQTVAQGTALIAEASTEVSQLATTLGS
jgi:hypothetical protein